MRDTGQTYYFHLRPVQGEQIYPCGGITVAFEYDAELKLIFWSYSMCSMQDNFEKKLGRIKAKGRLSSYNWLQSFQITQETTVHKVIQTIKEKLFDLPKIKDSPLFYSNLI